MPNRRRAVVVADSVVVVSCEWRYSGHSANIVNAMADRMAGLQLIRDACIIFLSGCGVVAGGCNNKGFEGSASDEANKAGAEARREF